MRDKKCSICDRSERLEIDGMLRDEVPVNRIVTLINQRTSIPISRASLRRHIDGKHSEGVEIDLAIQQDALARKSNTDERAQIYPITNDDAPQIPHIKTMLAIVIGAGLDTILKQPWRVTPKVTIEAIEVLRKIDEGGVESEELKEAWATFNRMKAKKERKKITRSMTITETETLPPEEADWTIDALDALPPPIEVRDEN